MNKHLLLALLFIPMAACGDANADTVGSGSDVTLQRFIVDNDDFSLNARGDFDPILIPVPANSVVLKAEWLTDECNKSFRSSEESNTNGQVWIDCENYLNIRPNSWPPGHYSIIIAY